MAKRVHSREFELEAYGWCGSRSCRPSASRGELGYIRTRCEITKLELDPERAFEGHRQLKPADAEVARLERVTAERDILEERRLATLRRNPREVRLHGASSRHLAGALDESGTERLRERVLRMAGRKGIARGQQDRAGAGRRELRGSDRTLRKSASMAGSARLERAMQRGADGSADTAGRLAGTAQATAATLWTTASAR
jgi:hypothetical protein